jgi:hypothetical protein
MRKDYGVTLGTIYFMARERGWTEPRFKFESLGVWDDLSVTEIAAILIEDRDYIAAKKRAPVLNGDRWRS